MPYSFSDKVEKLISILRVLVPWWLPEQLQKNLQKTLVAEAITELEAAIADLDNIMEQLETNGRNGQRKT